MTDVLLLDVMGTLVYDPFMVEIPAFFDMSLQEVFEDKHPDAWIRFEHGEMSEGEMLANFFADGRAFDHAAFEKTVRGAYRYLDGIEALLTDLRALGVPMHTMSNYPSWYRWIEASLELSQYLPWTFVSCETGIRKPAPEAYENAARTLGVPPQQCVFVDDRRKNVDAARAVGMRGIVFEDAAQLRAELARVTSLAL